MVTIRMESYSINMTESQKIARTTEFNNYCLCPGVLLMAQQYLNEL